MKLMLDKLKNINDAVLAFMTRNIAKIMGLAIMGIAGLMILSYTHYDKPTNAKEFAKTSVKILNMRQNSGGSGVILESNSSGSKILTNKHVCNVIESGGYVVQGSEKYQIREYKKYLDHDLCLVRVMYDLGINTQVSEQRPPYFSKAFISGHPALMPPVLTDGNFSGREIIRIITKIRKCEDKDWEKYGLYCLFFGGIPIVEFFESQLVTGTILPGSSGSGVFDIDGTISGLVFAGRSRELTYAYVVPHEYIVDFVENQDDVEWKTIGSRNRYSLFLKALFKFEKTCDDKTSIFKTLCRQTKQIQIWRNE